MNQKRKWSVFMLAMVLVFSTQLISAEIGDALQLLSYRAESGFAPDVTDGQIAPVTDPTDWRAAYVRKADFDVDGVSSAPKQTSLLFSNDNDFLYIAVGIPLDNAANGNRLTIYFDQGASGTLDANAEYYVSMLADGTSPVDGYWDGAVWVQNTVPAVEGIGLRKGSGTPALYNYELKIPLSTPGDASNNYLNISAGDEVGALFVVRMATGGNDEYIWTQTNADITNPSATGANGMTGWAEIKTIGDGIADRNMVSLAAKGILPLIDGNVSEDPNWKYAFSKDVIFTDYDGNKLNGTIKLKEEEGPDRMIIGVVIEDYSPAAADFLSFYNDQGSAGNDRNFILNTVADFDNAVRMYGNGTMSDYNFNSAAWVADGTSNGSGAAVSGTDWEIELEMPFVGDGTNDLNIAPQDVIGALFHLYDSTNNINYWLSSTINSEVIVIDPVDPVYNALGWLKLQTGGPFVQSIYPENGDTISGEYPLAVYALDPTDLVDPITGIANVTYEVRLEDTAAGTYTVITSGNMSKIEDDGIGIWTGTLDTRALNYDPSTLLKLVYVVDDGEIDPVSVPLDIYINNEGGGITLSDPECILNTPLPHTVLNGNTNPLNFTVNTDTLITLDSVAVYIDGEMTAAYSLGSDYTYTDTFNWDTSSYPDGEHIIQIWGKNSLDISNFSATTLVYTNNSPSVSLTAPSASSVLSGEITIEFNAAPIAPSTLVSTEISLDGSAWAAVTTAPASTGGTGSHTWDTTDIPDGTHAIQIRTTDSAGRMAYSEELHVITDNMPNVEISSPAASSVVSGEMTIEFTAAPIAPATLVTTEISVDGGAWTAVTTAPAAAGGTGSHDLDTSNLPDGTHEIIVRTTDDLGRIGYSADLNIITDNTDPTGVFTISPQYVKNGDTVTFEYNGREKNLTAAVTLTELQKLDSLASAGLTLTDTDGDGVYTASHTLSSDNTAGDGIKNILLSVTDAAGNIYSPSAEIILDNTDPVLTVNINPEPDAGKVYQKEIVIQSDYFDMYTESIVISHKNSNGDHIGNSPIPVQITDDNSFSSSVYLTEGYNLISISVTDKSGNITLSETELTFTDPRITKVIGPDGGTVEAPDGTKVIIPEGALLSDQEISVRTVSTETLTKPYNEIDLLNTAYVFNPENLIFHKPVTVSLAYNSYDLDPDLDGTDDFIENELEAFTLDGNTWLKLKVTGIETGNLVSFTTNHFSVYALGNENIDENFKFYWTKNPFSAEETTNAVIELNGPGTLSLKIYDTSGDLVRILADERSLAGTNNIKWDGKNDYGRYVGSGIYIYVLEYKGDDGTTKTVRKPLGVIK
ncbi:MAG: hypothetical protein JXN63_06075 [Candidatus Delongbacteria bacterium]|nr:hypothetical protein [Candidatus Delongbacteria bacterium]